ncbi:MAG: hypothetical protein ABIC04_02805 [Nanoarchaeota archaeon]
MARGKHTITSKSESRNLADIAQKYNVHFLHGLDPAHAPDLHSHLHEDTGWITKLKVLLCLEPLISVCTVSDHNDKMYADMGIVLNNGRVLDAYLRDYGTVPIGFWKRETSESNGGDLDRRIDRAINDRGRRHNEFSVIDYAIAGFYVCLGYKTGPFIPEIIQFTNDIGMDLFALENGKLMSTEIIVGKIRSVKQLPKDHIYKSSYTIDDASKGQFYTEVLTSRVFKLFFPERKFMRARESGMTTYIKLNVFAYDKSNICLMPVDFKINGVEFDISYKVTDGYIVCVNKRNKKSVDNTIDKPTNGIHIAGEFIHTDNMIVDNEDYISAMQNYVSQAGQLDPDGKIRKASAFHLYGYAEQARLFNDSKAYAQASSLAKSILPEAEYNDVVKKRVLENNGIRLFIKDFE